VTVPDAQGESEDDSVLALLGGPGRQLGDQGRQAAAPGDSGLLADVDALGAETVPAATVAHGEAMSDSAILASRHAAWRSLHVPERLDRMSHYLICDPIRLVATWENNGRGWMVHTRGGMVSVHRNQDKLPSEGDFTLVALKLAMTDAGLRLEHIVAYRLSRRWALTRLEKGEDQVLGAVIGPGCLNRDQKAVVRNLIKNQFMRQVWEKAERVMEYLANTDYHSAGA
jgi:hypothetical protein